MGVSRRLKELNSDIQTWASEPAEPLHGLEGLKHMASSIVPGIYQSDILDGILSAPTEDGYDMAERLAKEEGLFVGYSTGSNVWSALQIAKKIKKGVVVTIACDSGDRYIPI